jgi:hypothetical protein
MSGATSSCCEFVFTIIPSAGHPSDKSEKRKPYCALKEERADIRTIESRRDEKKSSRHPVIFSYIAKNSIRHFLQEPGNFETVKEGTGESSERRKWLLVTLRIYIYIYSLRKAEIL